MPSRCLVLSGSLSCCVIHHAVHSEAKYGKILYFSYHVPRDLLSDKQKAEHRELLDVCVCVCKK